MIKSRSSQRNRPLKEISDYTQDLVGDRRKIESQYIASLYRDPGLFEDHGVDPEVDLIVPGSKLLYSIGAALYKMGNKVFDEVIIDTYLDTVPEQKKLFLKYGGHRSLNEICSLVYEQNADSYYEALLKSNMVCRLIDAGFNVKQNADQIKAMSSNEVFDFYESVLAEIALDSASNLRAIDLSSKEGYVDHIDEWDEGQSIGFRVGFPILNYRLAGIHTKNLLLHLGAIGTGKTTTAISLYILPAIENGTDVCVIANEQGESEWRQMVLATVLFNRTGCKTGMNRHSFLAGGFTKEQRAELNRATEWIDTQPGRIIFIEAQDYSTGAVSRIVRKYSKCGCALYVIDTFKNQDESSENAWATFSEAAKNLFQVAKHEDVAIIATAQLASGSMRSRYLDLTSVGKSRAISETATQVVMFRRMDQDEKKNLEVFKYGMGPKGRQKEFITLDQDKDYIILFTPKNRFGQTSPQIVYERDMDYNSMKEIGLTEIPFNYE